MAGSPVQSYPAEPVFHMSMESVLPRIFAHSIGAQQAF